MANYDVTNPAFNSHVRQLESPDWAHADVLNQTIKQAVINTVAIQKAVFRLGTTTIARSRWNGNQYTISDSRISSDSIADVYWSSQSKEQVIDCEVNGSTSSGKLILSCSSIPTSDLLIDLIEIRNEVLDDAL